MEPEKCSKSEVNSSRNRMLELAFSSDNLQPLSIDCDSTELYSDSVDNVPLLMICPSPLIDFGTYVEMLKKDYVFPIVRRDMSYSMELCCNNGASMEAGSSQAPPNVNLFAPVNSIRRPVRHRLQPDGNFANLEFDIYNDIPSLPSDEVMNFELRTPSVTSSRLSDYDLNGLESEGYVQMDPSVPQIDSNNFLVQSEDGVFEQQYFPPQYYQPYQPMPSEMGDIDPNVPSQSTVRNVSYIPPLVPHTDAISPIIPDLVTESTPIWINLPILYIIPVIPISIQPVFLAPIEPSTFTYMPAPWAFNCVLRTPFPQFIYSVEPCNSPGCPFSYRYRCPTPQIEHPEANECRRSNPCQFRRSGRFNYQCTNRLDVNIEDDTPKRNIENAPPPKRRLSDKFDSSDQSAPSAESTRTSELATSIETLTTMLDNTSITMKDESIGKLSQISVQITSRRDTFHRKKNYTRTSHTIEFRRNKRTGFMKRWERPRNMCFVRPTSEGPRSIHVIKSAILGELTRDRRVNWAEWMRSRESEMVRESVTSSSFSSVNRPYFLNLIRNGPLPNVLQEVSVPVINNSVCESMYQSAGYIEHIPNIFICAGWRKGGFDSCEGDSGGPMVIQRPDKRWLLAGIISWGIGCAEPNQPGVYTRISAFRDWINQILQF